MGWDVVLKGMFVRLTSYHREALPRHTFSCRASFLSVQCQDGHLHKHLPGNNAWLMSLSFVAPTGWKTSPTATLCCYLCRQLFLQTPFRHEIHSDVQGRIQEAFETGCEFREIAACYSQEGDIFTFQLLFLPVSAPACCYGASKLSCLLLFMHVAIPTYCPVLQNLFLAASTLPFLPFGTAAHCCYCHCTPVTWHSATSDADYAMTPDTGIHATHAWLSTACTPSHYCMAGLLLMMHTGSGMSDLHTSRLCCNFSLVKCILMHHQ